MMITVRRATERLHDRFRKRDVWSTFHPQGQSGLFSKGFEALESLDESLLPPCADAPRLPDHDAEIVTYVCSGALAYEDSTGLSGVIQAGEFQIIRVERGTCRSDTNRSRTNWAQVFQIRLRSSAEGFEPGLDQKRFSAADRRGRLCIVASPDRRTGSLALHRDARLYSALLAPGQHVVHEISEGRILWLHLVQGELTFSDLILTTGDGAGISAERALSLTAREDTEILLLDLGGQLPGSVEKRVGTA